MDAIILAAGVGARLGDMQEKLPKALLSFGGKTLLQRHLEILRGAGIERVTIVTGYRNDVIDAEIARIGAAGFVRTVLNPRFTLGSVVSMWSAREALLAGRDVIFMDADVLYDKRLMQHLVETKHANCFLLDRDIEPGEEPVKLCMKDGVIVDFGKIVERPYDLHGESVGFFRFDADMCRRLMSRADDYVAGDRAREMYEEVIRDMARVMPNRFGYEDVTGLPWIEIDFPQDVERATREILPALIA